MTVPVHFRLHAICIFFMMKTFIIHISPHFLLRKHSNAVFFFMFIYETVSRMEKEKYTPKRERKNIDLGKEILGERQRKKTRKTEKKITGKA